MFLNKHQKKIKTYPAIITQLALPLFLIGSLATFSQNADASFAKEVREFNDKAAIKPKSIAFSAKTKVFYVLEKRKENKNAQRATYISSIDSSTEKRLNSVLIEAIDIKGRHNLVFDSKRNRLLIYQNKGKKLFTITAKPNGNLDPATLTQHDVRRFNVKKPQGMTIDPISGDVFILDAASPKIVRIKLGVNGNIDQATIAREIDLPQSGKSNVRGLAFDSVNKHLHTLNIAKKQLVELDIDGKEIISYDLSKFKLKLSDIKAMVLAPSGDRTDDVSQNSLYMASKDNIMETAFSVITVARAATIPTFTSVEVKLTRTSEWTPASPDPAGITYLSDEGRLLISDSEVNELASSTDTNIDITVNLFKTTLVPDVVATSNTLAFSGEPTGTAFKSDPDPDKERLFISDDDVRKIFVLKSGADGLFGTADDILDSQFSTTAFGSMDPEGVAFNNNGQGTLFIADGLNNEIYKVTSGANGIFDGVDDVITSFDTANLGIIDPEGITFDTNSGHLYIVGEPQSTIIKVSTNGTLVQNIDISDAYGSEDITRTPSGLAFAPSSTDPSVMNLYITNRRVDNNQDPNENDGKIHEMTLPSVSVNNPPIASDDNYVAEEGQNLNVLPLGVLGNDTDSNGDPLTAVLVSNSTNGTLTLNSDGSFNYTPNAGFTGTDSFTYHASDGVNDSNQVTVTLTVNAGGTNNLPIANDDAYTTRENQTLNVLASGVLGNDTDLDGTPLNAMLVSDPSNGTLTLNSDGSFTYVPNSGYIGMDSFTYHANDGLGDSNNATITLCISK